MNSSATRITVRVIEAGSEYADMLAALHKDLFTPAWDSTSFKALIDHPGSVSLVAVPSDGEHPTGYVLGRVIAGEAEILSLGVARKWQRRGIAAALITELARLVAARGASHIFLEVAADNHPALELYRLQGFSEVGRRPGYYDRQNSQRSDALILTKAV